MLGLLPMDCMELSPGRGEICLRNKLDPNPAQAVISQRAPGCGRNRW